MNGYVICNSGDDALTAFDDPTVRYAASLDNGEGIFAWEGDHLDGKRFMEVGRVLVATEREEPEWFGPFPIPKRRLATGTECWYLTNPIDPWVIVDEAQAFLEEGVNGLAIVTGGGAHRVLIETDGPRHWWGLEWFAVSVEFRDSRLAVSA